MSRRRFTFIERLETRRMLSGAAPFQFGDALYYSSSDAEHGAELWSSKLDGSSAHLVKDLYQGTGSSAPNNFAIVDGKLVFDAFDIAIYERVRWQTDGTSDGTRIVPVQLIDSRTILITGGDEPDNVQMTSDGTITTVIMNGESKTFDDAVYRFIDIQAGGGDDLVDLGSSIYWPSSMQGEDGNDTLVGGRGGDTLIPGPGSDSVDGGAGSDLLDYTTVTDNISGGRGKFTIGTDTDFYSNFEGLWCGSGNDHIEINTYDTPSGPSDPIRYINGGNGNDYLSYFDAAASGGIAPTVDGGEGDDTLSVDREGGYASGSPVSAGPAYYFGGLGDDTFVMFRSFANRDFNGGPGIDSVNYGNFSTVGGIKVTLDDKPGDGPGGFDNVHSDVEIVHGTPWNDTLIGSPHDETLFGENGDDVLIGNGGNDSLLGGGQSDLLVAPTPANGILSVIGTAGDDQILLYRDPSNSTLLDVVRNGALAVYRLTDLNFIQIDARGGNDLVQFNRTGAPIAIRSKIYGGAGNDVIYGSAGNDRIYGGDGNDWINAGAGDDVIFGEAGNDRLFGGDGNDYLDGGAGSDVLRGDAGIDRIFATISIDDYSKNRGDLISLTS